MDIRSNEVLLLGSCPPPGEILSSLARLTDQDKKLHSFCTFSSSIYDTAWLSMPHRRGKDDISWLFPRCFEYLLESQLKDGTWISNASPVDGILNTLAGLYSIVTQIKHGDLEPDQAIALDWRIHKARSGLQNLLEAWDVDETVHVGFEILIPSLLRQLKDFEINFQFSRLSKAHGALHAQNSKLQLCFTLL